MRTRLRDSFYQWTAHLLWVQNFDDLCDVPRVKCWDDAAAGRQELQLECLKKREKIFRKLITPSI